MTKENPLPVDTIEFWQERVFRTIATGKMLHQIIWDDSYDLWCWMQTSYAGILKEHISPGQKVLDAGCGYGALLGSFEEARFEVDYLGVDFSPDLIRLARYRYPNHKFECINLYSLPYPDKSFDWTVVRSVDGMLEDNLGYESWPPMHKELQRVSKKLLIGGYPKFVGDVVQYTVE